jgi:hypothetical protein
LSRKGLVRRQLGVVLTGNGLLRYCSFGPIAFFALGDIASTVWSGRETPD